METSATHGLGFAPDSMDTLADHLKNRKFTFSDTYKLQVNEQ